MVRGCGPRSPTRTGERVAGQGFFGRVRRRAKTLTRTRSDFEGGKSTGDHRYACSLAVVGARGLGFRFQHVGLLPWGRAGNLVSGPAILNSRPHGAELSRYRVGFRRSDARVICGEGA